MLSEMPPRIQNLRFKLLNYDFTVEYCPGKEMIDVDALSRAPAGIPTDQDLISEKDIQCHVNALILQLPASDSRLMGIKEKTASDPVLTELVTVVMNGWPDDRKSCSDNIKPYWEHRGDITVVKGLILRGSQIIIPSTMRSILEKLHEGHLGMVKCKRRARNSCFWPNMNQHIENMVKGCYECSKHQPSKETETLQPHEAMAKNWNRFIESWRKELPHSD